MAGDGMTRLRSRTSHRSPASPPSRPSTLHPKASAIARSDQPSSSSTSAPADARAPDAPPWEQALARPVAHLSPSK
eukprot:4050315-Alexandrium_andersonii.AAC.1